MGFVRGETWEEGSESFGDLGMVYEADIDPALTTPTSSAPAPSSNLIPLPPLLSSIFVFFLKSINLVQDADSVIFWE